MTSPATLNQLLKVCALPLWKGLAYERTAHRNVEQFIEIVGDLPLSEVKTATFDGWRKALTVSEATVNRKLANIHSVLQYAVDRDWMVKVPKMPWQTESEGRIRWISPDEERVMFELLDKWGESEVALFLMILIDTGMRRGELLTATASQIDGDWLRLWKTKTKQARSVPLSARAKEALAKGLPWTVTISQLRTVWDKLKSEMGLEGDGDFVLHTLRHTAATRTLKKTKNIVVVQRLLGHSKIKTTLRYSHLADDELLAAVQ